MSSGYGGIGSSNRPGNQSPSRLSVNSLPLGAASAGSPNNSSSNTMYPQTPASIAQASSAHDVTRQGTTSPSARTAQDHAWVLEPIVHEGKTYLLDRASGSVYKDTRDGQWPQLVGRMDASGRINIRHQNSANDLFHALDNYLKTQQVRFQDLFNNFDKDRSGTLEGHEMRSLVKALLPDVSEHELRYLWAMVDTNGDGSVTREEFLSAAKACLEAERAAAERQAEAQDALRSLQQYLQTHQTEAQALFMSLDQNHSGRLEVSEQLSFFKGANRRLTPTQLRVLMAHVHSLFAHSFNGAATLIDLQRAFNVTPMQRQTATGNSYSSSSYSSTAQPATQAGGLGSAAGIWQLQEVVDAAGRPFVLDPETKVVFHPLPRPGASWPEVYGKLDARGQVVAIERKSEGGLFAALDKHLKTTQARLSDVFAKHSKGRNYLDPDGLLDLLWSLMPTLTKGDLYYFQVMLDVNGDGRVEQDELLAMVKEGMTVEANQRNSNSADYGGLEKLSTYIARNQADVKRWFDQLDSTRKGYLKYPEFAELLRKALPNLTSQEKRTIFTYLASMDAQQEGHVTLKQALQVFCKPTIAGKQPSAAAAGTGQSYGSSTSTTGNNNRSGASNTTAASGPARLRELRVGQQRYLLDANSNKVYTDDDYPEYVGTWDGRDIQRTRNTTATTLFQSLDTYLKSAQVRLRDLFNKFDKRVPPKGYLTVHELKDLVKELMPAVTNADARYFQAMIDQNGDNRIEYDEFLDTAKACMADESRGKGHTEVRDALKRVKQYLVANKASVEQLFRRHDTNGNGLLEPTEVAALFRSCMPTLTPQQLRYLLTHLHTISRHNDGNLSFADLLSALRAADVEPQSTSNTSPAAYGSSTAAGGYGGSSSPGTAAGNRSAAYTGDASTAWSLEEWFDPRGAAYLLNRNSSILYMDNKVWPQPVGLLVNGRMQPKKVLRPGQLFSSLDAHLKAQQLPLADLFRRYDGDGDGELTLPELARLLKDLRLQDVTDADILYFQAMMDVDGNGRISRQELLDTAKSVMEAAKLMTAGTTSAAQGSSWPQDVTELLDRVSKYISANLDDMKKRWVESDASRNGFLEPAELAAFLRRLIKGLGARQQHYLLMHLAEADVTGAGTISFQEMCISLRAVAPRTPRGVVHQTGFTQGPATVQQQGDRGSPMQATGSAGRAAAARPGPYSKSWRLKDHEHRGSFYLLDSNTQLLYHDAPVNEWPTLVGRLEAGQLRTLGTDAATRFFTALDSYLKENQRRFQDVFDRYDTARKGSLGLRELAALVRDILPTTTEAQVKYFQLVLDANGDQRITAREILDAAKDTLAKLKTASGGRNALLDPSAAPTLQTLSEKLYSNTADSEAMFNRMDTTASGYLDYHQLLAFLRKLSHVPNQDVPSLMTLIHLYDGQSEGQVTFQEVLVALRAVDCISGKGTHTRGFNARAGTQAASVGSYDSGYSRAGGTQASSVRTYTDELPSSWDLQLYRSSTSSPSATRGSRDQTPSYLIDQDTNLLYTQPRSAAEWPQQVGKVARDGRLVLRDTSTGTLNFFKVLDQYLKEQQVRFKNLFDQFDRDRSQALDSSELRRLVKALMPDVSEHDLAYFQALMDCGGSQSLTCERFLAAAKQCMSIEADARRQEVPAEVLAQLTDLSKRMAADKRDFQACWARYDRAATGRLGAHHILQALREFRPALTEAALRYIGVVLSSWDDAEGRGELHAKQVMQALHAVELRTPEYTFKPGTWFSSGMSTGGGSGTGRSDSSASSRHTVRREAIIKSVDLEALQYERKQYLLDAHSGVVYEPMEPRDVDAWPKAVGMYDARSRTMSRHPSSATSADLFTALDGYLKKEKMRFSELFRKYDRNGNGDLDSHELARLVKDLLGPSRVGPADVSYFQAMLDLEGNRSVSETEFLAVAKDFVAVEAAMSSGGGAAAREEVRQALSDFSHALAANKEGGYEEFLRLDVGSDGCIDHRGVLQLARRLCPRLRQRELHFLLTHLHAQDAQRDGRFKYNDLLAVFRAVPFTYPNGGKLAAGFNKSKARPDAVDSRTINTVLGGGSPHSHGRRLPSVKELVELKQQKLDDGRSYWVDPSSGYVYEPSTGGEYPAVAGQLDKANKLRRPLFNKDNDLFTHLDHFLKEKQVRLRDVFDSLDRDRSGSLEHRELARLLDLLLGQPDEVETTYFQVMLDKDGDGSITFKELQTAIQECWEQGKSVVMKSSAAAADALTRASTAIKANLTAAQEHFVKHGSASSERLDLRRLASFLRDVLPRVSPADVRYVLSHIHFCDTLGEGTASFTDLMHVLNVVDLKPPTSTSSSSYHSSSSSAGTIIRGGSFPRPRATPRQTVQSGASGRTGAGAERGRDVHSAGRSEHSTMKEWVLQDWRPSRGSSTTNDSGLLLDADTHLVYRWDKEEQWPALVGQQMPDSSMKRLDASTTASFFKALDTQLKSGRMRLDDFLTVFQLDDDVVEHGLDPDEFRRLVMRLVPHATQAQVGYLEAVMDLDGDNRVTAQEILDNFKQLREVGARVLRLEEPGLVHALNKLSDSLAKDQRAALALFMECDREGRGSLHGPDVARLLRQLLPSMRRPDLLSCQAHLLHLLDANGNGGLEFRELLTGLRAVPVRVGARSHARAPFRARKPQYGDEGTRSTDPHAAAAKSRAGQLMSAGARLTAQRTSRRSAGSLMSSSDDGSGEGYQRHHMDIKPVKQGMASLGKEQEVVMRLQEATHIPPAAAASLLGSNSGTRLSTRSSSLGGSLTRSHGAAGGALLHDPDTGLLYEAPANMSSGQAVWPRLVGLSDPDTASLIKVTPLPQLSVFRDLYQYLGSTDEARRTLASNFSQLASVTGHSQHQSHHHHHGRHHRGESGGEFESGYSSGHTGHAQLPVQDAVAMLDRMLPDGLGFQTQALLAALLPFVAGDSVSASRALKALALLAETQQSLCEPDSALMRLLMSLSTALSTNVRGVLAAAKQAAQQDGQPASSLDAHGLMNVLQQVAPSMLGGERVGAREKAGVVMWAFYHAPHRHDGSSSLLHVLDLLKAFRAVRCKLPDGRTIPPGISAASMSLTGTYQHRLSSEGGRVPMLDTATPSSPRARQAGWSAPAVQDMSGSGPFYPPQWQQQAGYPQLPGSQYGAQGLMQAPTDLYGSGHQQLPGAYQQAYPAQMQAPHMSQYGSIPQQQRPPVLAELTAQQAAKATGAVPPQFAWSQPQATNANLNDSLSSTRGRSGMLASRGRPMDLPTPPPPRIYPARRVVNLKSYKAPQSGANDKPLVWDQETGLVYVSSSSPDWPELYGKASPSGKLFPVSTGDVFHVFDAMRKLSGDEARLLQVFKAYDRNGNGSLDQSEVVLLCRQMAGLAYPEACFVQAMLDADHSGTISFSELVEGVRRASSSLDSVSRLEREVVGVLGTASAAVSTDLDVFWAAYAAHDKDGNGYLDVSELSRFFRALFKGIGSWETRLMVAYVFMLDVERDGLVRPDELLQALRALPMTSPTGVTHKPGFPTAAPQHSDVLGRLASSPRKQLPWQSHAPDAYTPGGVGRDAAVSRSPSPSRVAREDHYAPSQYPQQAPASFPPATLPATSHPSSMPTGAASAQPYMMMSGGPDGEHSAPVMGYILPYNPELYSQLVGSASPTASPAMHASSPSRSASPARRTAWERQQDVEVMDEFVAEPPPVPAPQPGLRASGSPAGSRPSSPASRRADLAYDSQAAEYGSAGSEGDMAAGRYPVHHQGHHHHRHHHPGHHHHHHHAQYPHQQQQDPYHDGRQGVGSDARPRDWLADAPPLEQWRAQQQEIQDLGFSPSALAPGGTPPSSMWRAGSAAGYPAGAMSVMSDAGPYARRTSFGIMQELHQFITTRRDAFYSHFMMVASVPGGQHNSRATSPVRGAATNRSSQPLASKAGVVAVVQRAVPGASHADIRYVQQMIDAALPTHRTLSMDDLEWAARQGAAVERQVSRGQLPHAVTSLFSSLASHFYEGSRQRTLLRFRELDTDRSGTLGCGEQLFLLQGLMQMRPSDLMWVSAALANYCTSGGRNGYLTYEELGEALMALARTAAAPRQSSEGIYRPDLQGQIRDRPYGYNPAPTSMVDEQMYGQAKDLNSRPGYGPSRPGPYAADEQQPRGWSLTPGGLAPPSLNTGPQQGSTQYDPALGPQYNRRTSWDQYSDPAARYGYASGPTGYERDRMGAAGSRFQPPFPGAAYGPGASMPGQLRADGYGDNRYNGVGYGGYGASREGAYAAAQAAWQAQGAAGHAYFMWTHDARQKVLEQYFAKDHARKARVLEEQKRALESQVALKKANFSAALEVRKVEQAMSNLARQVEKNAYELTGQVPVSVCTTDQLTARVNTAMDEAINVTRKKAALLDDPTMYKASPPAGSAPATAPGAAAATASGKTTSDKAASGDKPAAGAAPPVPGRYHTPPDMATLMSQLSSSDWLDRMALPQNLETLKVALAARKEALDQARLHDLDMHELQLASRQQAMQHEQDAHARAIQLQLLQAQLQQRLVAEASQATAEAAAVVQAATEATRAAVVQATSPTASLTGAMEEAVRQTHYPHQYGLGSLPTAWQLTPGSSYLGLPAGFQQHAVCSPAGHGSAAVTLVPRATSD